MGVRYGYWRMRQLRVYPSRARLREFLPWIGLIATLACYSLSFSFSEMYLRDFSYSMIGSYLSILVLVGLSSELTNRNLRRKLPLGGTCLVILSLMILHTSFSIGLLSGFLGMNPPSNERVRSANHSSNRGGN